MSVRSSSASHESANPRTPQLVDCANPAKPVVARDSRDPCGGGWDRITPGRDNWRDGERGTTLLHPRAER